MVSSFSAALVIFLDGSNFAGPRLGDLFVRSVLFLLVRSSGVFFVYLFVCSLWIIYSSARCGSVLLGWRAATFVF